MEYSYSHALSGTEKTKEVKMIEQVINRRNMHHAYQQVLRNKGCAGVDGMEVSELRHYIKQYREAIVDITHQSLPGFQSKVYHCFSPKFTRWCAG